MHDLLWVILLSSITGLLTGVIICRIVLGPIWNRWI